MVFWDWEYHGRPPSIGCRNVSSVRALPRSCTCISAHAVASTANVCQVYQPRVYIPSGAVKVFSSRSFELYIRYTRYKFLLACILPQITAESFGGLLSKGLGIAGGLAGGLAGRMAGGLLGAVAGSVRPKQVPLREATTLLVFVVGGITMEEARQVRRM